MDPYLAFLSSESEDVNRAIWMKGTPDGSLLHDERADSRVIGWFFAAKQRCVWIFRCSATVVLFGG